ncbi:hypothetical protein ABPG72_021682 [Tetrahymena utriculariae]
MNQSKLQNIKLNKLFKTREKLLFEQSNSRLIYKIPSQKKYDLTDRKSELSKLLKNLILSKTKYEELPYHQQLSLGEFHNIKFEESMIKDNRQKYISEYLELLLNLQNQENFEQSIINPFVFKSILSYAFKAKKMEILVKGEYQVREPQIDNQKQIDQTINCFELLRDDFTEIHIEKINYIIEWDQTDFCRKCNGKKAENFSQIYEIDLSNIKVDSLVVRSQTQYDTQNIIKIVLENSISHIKLVQQNFEPESFTQTKNFDIQFLNQVSEENEEYEESQEEEENEEKKECFVFELTYNYETCLDSKKHKNNLIEYITKIKKIAQYRINFSEIFCENEQYQKDLNKQIFNIDRECEQIIFYNIYESLMIVKRDEMFQDFQKLRNKNNAIRYQLTAVSKLLIPLIGDNDQQQLVIKDLFENW